MKCRLLCMLLSLLLLLTGCFADVPAAAPTQADLPSAKTPESSTPIDTADPTDVPEQEPVAVTTYPAPDIYSYPAQVVHPMPAEDGGYYSIRYGSNLLRYIGADGTEIILCGHGGCTHSDETCPAYYDHLSRFTARNGKWYVVTEDTEEAVELFSVDPASGKRTSLIRWTADENAWITMDSFLCTDTAIICVLRTSSIYEDEATSALECVYLEDGTKKTLRTVTDGQTIRVMGAVSAGLVVETGMLEEEPMDFATYQRSHPDVTEDEYSKYYFDAVEQNTKLVLELVSLDGTVLDTIVDTKDGYVPPVSAGICWNETVIYRKGNLLYCYDSTTQEAMPLETDGDVINYFVYDGHVWQPYRQDNAVRCVVCDIHTGETAELFTISGGMPGIYAETDDNFLVVAESGILSIAKQDFYRGDFARGTVLVEYS